MIGPLGTTAFAAVGQGSMMVHYLMFPMWGIGTATGAIVSRNIGKGDTDAAGTGGGQGLLLAILSGILFTVIGIVYGEEMLILLGTEPDVVALGSSYLTIVFSFSVFSKSLAWRIKGWIWENGI